jgi:hypothetical protein
MGLEKLSGLYLKINKRHYREKVMNNSRKIRIAVQPRDPPEALDDQKEMIRGLTDINYNFLTYDDILRLFC